MPIFFEATFIEDSVKPCNDCTGSIETASGAIRFGSMLDETPEVIFPERLVVELVVHQH
jgi:hypothetical protein